MNQRTMIKPNIYKAVEEATEEIIKVEEHLLRMIDTGIVSFITGHLEREIDSFPEPTKSRMYEVVQYFDDEHTKFVFDILLEKGLLNDEQICFCLLVNEIKVNKDNHNLLDLRSTPLLVIKHLKKEDHLK